MTEVNFILLDGGVGDHIASLSAVSYLCYNYPHVRPLIWTPSYLREIAEHVLPRGTAISDYTQMAKNYNRHKPTKTTKWDGIISPMKIHLLDYAFLKLCDENPSIEYKNYPIIRPNEIKLNASIQLPDKYVVITTGYTAQVREFKTKAINEVIDFIQQKGYAPVFLGKKEVATGAKHIIEGTFDTAVNYEVGLNLVDKTTLLQAAKIMSGAKAIVGVDNGLLHLAGCTETAIVGGFTTVSPQIRMPIRHNVLGWNFYPVVPKDLKCLFCQEKTNFHFGHDYRNCLINKGDKKKPIQCVEKLQGIDFIEQLEKIL